MIEILSSTLLPTAADLFSAHFTSALGVFVRVGAIIALAPAFGETVIPLRIRLAIVLAFTTVVWPALSVDPVPATTNAVALLIYVLAEASVGALFGIGLRVLVMVLQIAGTIAAQSTSLAQFFGGAGVDPQPAMSQILVVSGLALAVTLGLHIQLAELLVLSYTIFPQGQFPLAGDVGDWGVAQISRAFSLAFSLAMPFVILSLIYSAALGAISKAMPQLMVALVGAPAITAGGLALLMLTAPMILPVWHEALGGFLINPESTPR